jgi:hypothetical protein
MDTKPVLASKIVWLQIVVLLTGIIPLMGTFLKVVLPDEVVIIDASIALVAGILTIVARVWFTDTTLE